MACIKKRREEQNREQNILNDETEQERNDRELDNADDVINNQVQELNNVNQVLNQVLNNVDQILNNDVAQDIPNEIIEKEKAEDDFWGINIFGSEDDENGDKDPKKK